MGGGFVRLPATKPAKLRPEVTRPEVPRQPAHRYCSLEKNRLGFARPSLVSWRHLC